MKQSTEGRNAYLGHRVHIRAWSGGTWTRQVLFAAGRAHSTGERDGRPDGKQVKPIGHSCCGQGR